MASPDLMDDAGPRQLGEAYVVTTAEYVVKEYWGVQSPTTVEPK
jgi:hypothetical protein